MRAIASRCVRGNLVGFLSRGGIPPVLVGFLCPSIVGADVALDDARRLGRTGRFRARYLAVRAGARFGTSPLGCV